MESEAPYNDEHLGDRIGRLTLQKVAEYISSQGNATSSAFRNTDELKELKDASPEERARYKCYTDIVAWLIAMRNAARGYKEQARLGATNVMHFTNDAITGETFDSFLPVLPAIMTSQGFLAARRQGIEDYCVKDGQEIYQSAYDLFLEAVEFYLSRLEENPEADNPLRAIRERYEAEPVKSQYILSIWHKVHGHGHYTRAGERSALMSRAEFDKFIEQEEWDAFYDIIKNYLEGGSISFEKDLLDAPGGIRHITWQDVTGKVEELTKWEAVNSLGKLYSREDADIEDMADEFPELLSAISDRVSKDYKLELLHTPIKEWKKPFITRRRLCKMSYYTQPQKAGTHYKQREPSGIAVIQDAWDVDTAIYAKPRRILYREQTLEGYIDECGASRKKDIITAWQMLQIGYCHVYGYNTAVELIANIHKAPGVVALKVDATPLLEAANAIKCVVELLFSVVAKLPESDKLRTKKLMVVKNYFLPPRLEKFVIPQANIKKASTLIKSFKAFSKEHFEELFNLLMKRPTPGGQTDGQAKPRE